jgi:spore coat protein A, manganese oxidase
VKTTRRRFIQTSALAGAGVTLAGGRVWGQGPAAPYNLRKFIAPLPGLGPTGIPIAEANKWHYPGTDFYRIVLGQYRQQMHPDLPPTKLWGYADATTGLPKFRYAGPAIVATSGTPTRIQFVNLLPRVHPLPVDVTIPGAETGQQVNRAAVHLHGGFVPWPSDGGPFHWFAPNGTRGPSVIDWLPDRLGRMTDDYWYPNAQSARLMWYHDHAVGMTRLNAYAGLAAPYVIVDNDEIALFGPTGSLLRDQLPGIPLALQDKSFKKVADAYGNVGDLWYPSVGEQDRDTLPDGKPALDLPVPSCVPEFFADNIVVNGMAFPELKLKKGAYRFRLLNGTQSRVFNLQLYFEDPINPGEANLAAKGPDFVQIGTEGGFLPAAAVVSSGNPFVIGGVGDASTRPTGYVGHDTSGYGLVLAGAERADVIIDFTTPGNYILYNDAPGPFFGGGPETDYFTGADGLNGNAASGPLGYGPNTRTMMRFKIRGDGGQAMPAPEVIDQALRALDLGLLTPYGVFEPPAGAVLRNMTLNEGWDRYGRLIQLLGTDVPNEVIDAAGGYTKYGQPYLKVVGDSDRHSVGDTEVWDIYNTTADVHPIHFHLVTVQIVGRAPFVPVSADDGNPAAFTPGPFVPPDPNERGWKETVRMNPGEVTRVIMKFELPPDPVVNVRGRNRTVPVPESPRTGGYEYVWHCHILEHEEHDMMQPLVVRKP